jgi:hypothetical protein
MARRDAFRSRRRREREFPCYFLPPIALAFPTSHVVGGGRSQNREKTHEEAFEIDRCACLGVVRAGACRDGNAGVGGSERVLPPGHHVRNALLQLYQPGAMSGDVRRSRGQLLPGSIPDRRQQRPGLSTKVFPRQKRDTPRQDAGWESVRPYRRSNFFRSRPLMPSFKGRDGKNAVSFYRQKFRSAEASSTGRSHGKNSFAPSSSTTSRAPGMVSRNQ